MRWRRKWGVAEKAEIATGLSKVLGRVRLGLAYLLTSPITSPGSLGRSFILSYIIKR